MMSKKIITWTLHESIALQQIGFAIVRISFGIALCIFGYQKLLSGTNYITQVGSAMSLFGISRGYILWGYLAALTELCSGLALIVGFFTRIASLPLIWLLIVALRFHINKSDPFSMWAFLFVCFCATIAFLIAGSNIYSVDHVINSMTKEPKNMP
jgi:putative oxidoreductase